MSSAALLPRLEYHRLVTWRPKVEAIVPTQLTMGMLMAFGHARKLFGLELFQVVVCGVLLVCFDVLHRIPCIP